MQTILVIDDEANMRHMLTALLGKSGYAVTTAADGSEGLRLAGEHRFDFILCDLKMPVMDGLAFLAGMRAADLGGTVIMMSAYGTVDQAIETVKQGAYDYISKPFKLDEILLVLRKAEERERLRDENRQLRRRLDALDGQRSFGGMVGRSGHRIAALAEQGGEHVAHVRFVVDHQDGLHAGQAPGSGGWAGADGSIRGSSR